MTQIKRALLSVSDKTGIVELAQELKLLGVELISTGGTFKALTDKGIVVTPIEKVTGNPEAFGGRMKTISFQVESALLYRRDVEQDQQDAKELEIEPIDLVVCNLYPFADAVKNEASEEELVEKIDIGGPTMVRAGAKNFKSVTVLTSPGQYEGFLEKLKANKGELSYEDRRQLALEAFVHTAQYEGMIANEFSKRFDNQSALHLNMTSSKELRYGENSHQKARYYQTESGAGVGNAPVLQGKELSYNNLLDADAAWKCASDVWHASGNKGVACTVVKHLNPCGVAVAETSERALELAWECDPVSAFGSIIAFTAPVTKECVEWLKGKFIEVIMAPSFEAQALELLQKRKNVRVLVIDPKPLENKENTVKSILGGVLVQDEDEGVDPELQCMTQTPFPDGREELVHFGVMVNKYLKSNSVALVTENEKGERSILGAGMGQPNRIDALRKIAAPMARERGGIEKAFLISDAFFPFADSIEVCHQEGIKFIVQPGGSIRDKEVIEACDQYGIAMVFTGRRHFRH
jgi:phosphoribosylaminoimidazolecarboxamide formyltransferase/IMP cyclohydrolase